MADDIEDRRRRAEAHRRYLTHGPAPASTRTLSRREVHLTVTRLVARWKRNQPS